MYQFKLYIAGKTARSNKLISELDSIFKDSLAGLFSLQVVDVIKHPNKAREDEIVATPTLLKKRPLPERKFFGYPDDNKWLLKALGLVKFEPDTKL